MQIKFEGFENKEEKGTVHVRLKIGVWQSLKIGLGLGLGFAIATTIVIIVSLVFGFSILEAMFKSTLFR